MSRHKDRRGGFGIVGILITAAIITILAWGIHALSKSSLNPVNQIEEGQSAIEQAQQAKDAIESADRERLEMLQE